MTAQEQTPLDPAAIMAAHRDRNEECDGCREACLYCEADHPWPCEQYRLAELAQDRWHYMRSAESERDRLAAENAALREQVQRVTAERDEARTRAVMLRGLVDKVADALGDLPYDDCLVKYQPAALAGEGTTEKPTSSEV